MNSVSDHPSPRPRTSRPWLSSWTVAASLGQAQRVMHRREDDARADLDPRRCLGERCADHQQRGHVPVIDEVVLRRPDRREAEALRLDG